MVVVHEANTFRNERFTSLRSDRQALALLVMLSCDIFLIISYAFMLYIFNY
jgi:hypothetical protein